MLYGVDYVYVQEAAGYFGISLPGTPVLIQKSVLYSVAISQWPEAWLYICKDYLVNQRNSKIQSVCL